MRKRWTDNPLTQALGLGQREAVSLVGAGGKTSLMFHLARELHGCGHRVITTTTTKIFEPGPEETPFLSIGQTLEAVLGEVDLHGHVTAVSQRLPERKVQGLTPGEVDALWKSGRADYVIVEADGASQRPLKAPESYEPVIPSCTRLVVGLVGAEALGAILGEEVVFRSRIFSRLTGLPLGAAVTHEAVSRAFTHPNGILRGAPLAARLVLFLNKIDLAGGVQKGRDFARTVLDSPESRIECVVLGRLRPDPAVVDVIFRE